MLATSKIISEVFSEMLYNKTPEVVLSKLEQDEPILAEIIIDTANNVGELKKPERLITLQLGLFMYLIIEKINDQLKNRESYIGVN